MADAHASGVLPHGKAVAVEARSCHGRVFNSSSLSMHILEVGMHWFPEGGGGADRYFYGLVSELAHQDYAMKAFVFGEGKSPGPIFTAPFSQTAQRREGGVGTRNTPGPNCFALFLIRLSVA